MDSDSKYTHTPNYTFLRRKSDGKYYRGAKIWKWTKSWRRAAILERITWIYYVDCGIVEVGDYDLVDLDFVIQEEYKNDKN